MTNKIAIGAAVLIGAIGIQSTLLWMAVYTHAAPYESEYFRVDEPAYHATPVKRLLTWADAQRSPVQADPIGRNSDLTRNRRMAEPLRLAGLTAFFALCGVLLGSYGGVAAFVIFLLMPPTFPYLVRLDSWMDSACLSLIAIGLISKHLLGRTGSSGADKSDRVKEVLIPALAGACTAWAIDAKLTAALTLVPAAILIVRNASCATVTGILSGFLAGYVLAQPAWLLNPASALAHVTFWKSSNADQPAFDALYPLTSLLASIPWTIWILAGMGAAFGLRDQAIRTAIILSGTPFVFFLLYRTFPPDGIRHFYLILPFLALIAGAEWAKLKVPWKFTAAASLAAELFFRTFPDF